MIKRILLGLGGTPYTTVAIQRAVELAKRFEAEITGVTVLDVERLTNVSGLRQGSYNCRQKNGCAATSRDKGKDRGSNRRV